MDTQIQPRHRDCMSLKSPRRAAKIHFVRSRLTPSQAVAELQVGFHMDCGALASARGGLSVQMENEIDIKNG